MSDLITEYKVSSWITGGIPYVEFHAGHYKDGHTTCLVCSIHDKRDDADEFYQLKFNADWMDEEKRKWLAQVLTASLYDIVEQAQNSFRKRIRSKVREALKLFGGAFL